ncbi:hypothetical protein [Williamsia sp.]|uniref:hypothetical protein n=1 Tax=Williamsia sp. TaxID=1872085 RepID=UPI001A274EC7|nr:hypothetical protein [Williamsia sp.]MBJ7287726.1 hypothetical protein [Williamsia sp.]
MLVVLVDRCDGYRASSSPLDPPWRSHLIEAAKIRVPDQGNPNSMQQIDGEAKLRRHRPTTGRHLGGDHLHRLFTPSRQRTDKRTLPSLP